MSRTGARVLVTGAAGFIGSHLTEALLARGAVVRALVHYNALGSRGWLAEIAGGDEIEVLFGDVGDADSVASAMEGCDTVFHLAALIGIPYSYVAPREYVRTNVEGTLNVLQAARRLATRRVVVTSTSEVYGTAQYTPMDESHPLVGQSPYAATKIGADQLAISFHRSFDVPVTIVRPFNAYGPRQSTRAIVPTIITQALQGGPLRLGSLDATRDLTFVLDTVEGFIRAADAAATIGTVVNVGAGRDVSVRELGQLICRHIGVECRFEVDPQRLRPEASEVYRLVADNSRARELMGWTPAYSLEQGLGQTIEWFAERQEVYRSTAYAT
jgi:NAD dependent epimerase/dehydratase